MAAFELLGLAVLTRRSIAPRVCELGRGQPRTPMYILCACSVRRAQGMVN